MSISKDPAKTIRDHVPESFSCSDPLHMHYQRPPPDILTISCADQGRAVERVVERAHVTVEVDADGSAVRVQFRSASEHFPLTWLLGHDGGTPSKS